MTGSAPVADGHSFSGMHVHLPLFDGPLDLLYYLIRKHELNVSEISLAVIADEFVAAVEAARELNLAGAGNFLVIAATLMHLKSKWLLPPDEETPGGDEQEQVGPLLQQLADLQKFREIVHELSLQEDRARAAFARPLTSDLARRLDQIAEQEPYIEMSAFELLKSMRQIQEFAFPPAREIAREEINLEDKITELLAIIKIRIQVSLSRLLNACRSSLETAVTFLAALELARLKVLRLRQTENFGEISATAREEGGTP